MKKPLAICLLLLVCLCQMCFAMTVVEVDRTCPLCETEFKAKVAASGTRLGMRLDLKPLGAIAAPWPVPVCPKCHFVVHDKQFTEDHLTKFRACVESKEYQAWGKERSSHFLLAKLLAAVDAGDLNIAHTYLKASWQEESSEKKLKEDLELSLKHFKAYLRKGPPKEGDDAESYKTALLLKGELLRRLGRFDDASAHLRKLEKMKEFKGTFLGDIVEYEIKLCADEDSKPHTVSDVRKAKKPEHEEPEKD